MQDNTYIKVTLKYKIKGFGSGITRPLGTVNVKLEVDGVKRTVEAHLVLVYAQDMKVLSGQPLTEPRCSSLRKTSYVLKFSEEFPSPEKLNAVQKADIFQFKQKDLTVPPWHLVNVSIYSPSNFVGDVYVQGGQRYLPAQEYIIPGTVIRLIGLETNYSSSITPEKQDCFAFELSELGMVKSAKLKSSLQKDKVFYYRHYRLYEGDKFKTK